MAREGSLVYDFLLGADKNIFEKLMEDLENSYDQEEYMQPKMMTQTYNILKNWKQYPRNMVQMVRTTTNSTVGEVVLINFDGNKADLTGTEIVLVDGKDGWEN